LLKNNITSLHRIRATTAFNFTSSPQIFTTSGFSFTYTPNSKPMSHIRKNLHQPLDQLHIFHSTPHLNRSPSAPRQHLVTTSSSPPPHLHLFHIRSLTLTLSHSYLRRSHHLIIFSKTSIVMHANREGGVLQHLFFKKSHKK